MRFINAIYTAQFGISVSNQELGKQSHAAVDSMHLHAADREKLLESIDYFLIGERTRRGVDSWLELKDFSGRADAFEAGATVALRSLAAQIKADAEQTGVVFDAIFTTTSTGSLMPGLSYRLASELPDLVRPNSMMIDLGHVGCTGGIKLLNLVRQLKSDIHNCLVVSVELPTTLLNWTATDTDIWQGNCTFGDGAAALWVSRDPGQGKMALAISDLQYFQYSQTGLDLIRWGYSDYYTFRLADETTFNRDVRSFIIHSLSDLDQGRLNSPNWAVHPAGIALLMRISRKLGLNRDALRPAANHYRQFSNMSSAGILYILRDIADAVDVGTDINLLTMGAGFNVIYGYVRKER